MKFYFIQFLCIILISINLEAQKKAIDSSAYGKWPSIGGIKVSQNTGYYCYFINNMPAEKKTLIIKNSKDDRQLSFEDASNCMIAGNNQYAIFTKRKDSLCITELKTGFVKYVKNVLSYKAPKLGDGQFMAYMINNKEKELCLLDLISNEIKIFKNVDSYYFNSKGSYLVIVKCSSVNNNVELIRINLLKYHEDVVWNGIKFNNLIFDFKGEKFAFTCLTKDHTELWNCTPASSTAQLVVSDTSAELKDKFSIDGNPSFSNDNKHLIFYVKNKYNLPSRHSFLHILNYKDSRLAMSQNYLSSLNRNYKFVADLEMHYLIRIEYDRETSGINCGNLFLVTAMENEGDVGEIHWNGALRMRYYLQSITNGRRVEIFPINAESISLSPGGAFVIYYNFKELCYMCYNTKNGVYNKLAKDAKVSWTDLTDDRPGSKLAGGVYMGWWPEDSAVFIQDHFDIWRIDPTGKAKTVNISGGFGRKNNIKLEFFKNNEYISPIKDTFLVKATNISSLENGFAKVIVSSKPRVEMMAMGPFAYGTPMPFLLDSDNGHSETRYIVNVESEKLARNIFVTSDFHSFSPISNLNPQSNYNWITTNLVTWKSLDGKNLQGVLYKPEDFDPNKKYPLLIYYYEKLSQHIHEFHEPDYSRGPIDIPTFVSNGYLVFTPDISYEIGNPGNSALNVVVSAAKTLSKKKWIDSSKIGIQGHSWGGYETNFIVAHSKIFAAAMSAAGLCDLVSFYGNGGGSQGFFEVGQGRMGSSLWENKEAYLKNSPILYADNVSTPLLLMNNKDDDAVPFQQGIEFFTALRRLNKKVWMLQYEGEGHFLNDDQKALDYTNRLFDFFNFYLKGSSMPAWMDIEKI